MKKKTDHSSKVILTLVVALLILFRFYHYNYLFTAAILLGLIGILFEFVSDKIAAAWMWLSGLLGKVMPKIVLGLVYFLFFVPYAVIYRIFRKNPLDLKPEGKSTFYKERDHLFTASDIENPW
jgi:predicted membrane protein